MLNWLRTRGQASDAPDGGAPYMELDETDDTPATVTQATSITTAVTINAWAGIITTVDPALAAAGEAEFSVNNNKVRVGDIVVVTVGSGPADNEHVFAFVSSVTLGAFTIVLSNLAAAAQADGAMTINFIVLRPEWRRFIPLR